MLTKACRVPGHPPIQHDLGASWFTLGVRATVWGALVASVGMPLVNAAHAQSMAYSDGLADRTAYEKWFATLAPLERAGADYWASQRSLRNPGPCSRATSGESDRRMEAGCREAQRRLAPADARRLSESDYRFGWNAFQESPPAPVLPTALAPVHGADVQPPAPSRTPTSAPGSIAPDAKSSTSCKTDVNTCKNIEEAVNNFGQIYAAKASCKLAANKASKFGNPEWGWFLLFGSFLVGPSLERQFKQTAEVTLVEDDILMPNGYGGKTKVDIHCHVVLRNAPDTQGAQVLGVSFR